MMLDVETDGRLQVLAGGSLLSSSNLIEWNGNCDQFVPVPRDTFEFVHRTQIDPVFGRLICWVNFSAGAEMLAKGVCLLRLDSDFRRQHYAPEYPTQDVDAWVEHYWHGGGNKGTVPVTHYGTLGTLTYTGRNKDGSKKTPVLGDLCKTVGATKEQREMLLAAYQLLGRSIRNRDAHAYVPNVRDAHFHVVPTLFADCFNLLLSWLPGGRSSYAEWSANAKTFVQNSG